MTLRKITESSISISQNSQLPDVTISTPYPKIAQPEYVVAILQKKIGENEFLLACENKADTIKVINWSMGKTLADIAWRIYVVSGEFNKFPEVREISDLS